jgi:hypothetical protein
LIVIADALPTIEGKAWPTKELKAIFNNSFNSLDLIEKTKD